MVDIYCKLIIAKRRLLDQVPDSFRTAVIERLKVLGYDINGDPVEVKH